MPDNSFDILSKIDLTEVNNAIQQALKEINTRYDLKDSKSTLELNEKERKVVVASADEYKLKAVNEILGRERISPSRSDQRASERTSGEGCEA